MLNTNLTEFYLTVAPGTENVALEELQQVWGFLLASDLRPQTEKFPEVRISKGGLSLTCELGVGLQLNFMMKTLVRVLVRVGHFKAIEFYQLEKSIVKIPWGQIFDLNEKKNLAVSLKVESQKSKLGQEKKIAQSIAKVLLNQKIQVVDDSDLEIYVRAFEDQWTISLNSSGDFLYKRGLAPLKGEAPLRENLAAVGLSLLLKETPPVDLSQITVIDPFAGSGTLLWEYLTFERPLLDRNFAFLKWKITPQWVKLGLKSGDAGKQKISAPSKMSVLGLDADPKMVEVLKSNGSDLQKKLTSQGAESSQSFSMELQQHDFWSQTFHWPNHLPAQKWIITNPPYGQRIPWSEKQKSEWLIHATQVWQPQRVAFIYPVSDLKKIKMPENYQNISHVNLDHGGQAVQWICLELKSKI